MLTKLINLVSLFREQSSSLTPKATESLSPPMPVAGSENPASRMKKTTNGSVVTFEGTYQGQPIRVRIFNAPTQESNL